MTEEIHRISAALARGRKAADSLGPTTDDLTETIAQFERVLAEQKFGVEASVEVVREHDDVDEEGDIFITPCVLLHFRKEAKTWRLMVETGIAGEPDSWRSELLVNSSREMRLLVVRKFPELVERLAEVAEAKLAEVDGALATLRDLVEVLQPNSSRRVK